MDPALIDAFGQTPENRASGQGKESSRTRDDLSRLYADLDAEITRANPHCEASGRCCRFKEYGHTLFLSEMEAAYLVAVPPPAGATLSPDGCPYQVNRLCTARERRPLGCRVYFCDPTFADQQVELSEKYVRRLKDLHEGFETPWHYRPLHEHLSKQLPMARFSSPGLVVLEDLP